MKKLFLVYPVLFFCGVFVFQSCTVKKRVHLPGYYISWKHTAHTGDKQDEKQDGKISRPEPDKEIATAIPGNIVASPVSDSVHQPAIVDAEPDNHIVNNTPSLTRPALQKLEPVTVVRSVKSAVQQAQGDSGAGPALMMILLGLLLILIGYIFLIALGIVGDVLWIIFAICGSILVFIGLIMLIISLF